MTALLNDTVGVMAAGRYYDPATEIGMIIGTGTNACYVEKVGAGVLLRVLPHALCSVLPHALHCGEGGALGHWTVGSWLPLLLGATDT